MLEPLYGLLWIPDKTPSITSLARNSILAIFDSVMGSKGFSDIELTLEFMIQSSKLKTSKLIKLFSMNFKSR